MMPGNLSILLFVAATLFSQVAAADDPAATNALPAARTFESFRIISDRNVFNQNRSSRAARRESSRPAAPVIQSLSLVGTMSFEKGNFAFFDGSRPEYKKPVKAGEKIAGYEVKEVRPDGVKIAGETNQFDMKVGQHLRREDNAEWQLSASRPAEQRSAGSSAASADTNISSGGSSGSEEEALKRLMEKRAKELKQ